MMTSEELDTLKLRLKKLIAQEDIGIALRATLASLPAHCAVANTLRLLQGRLHDLRRNQVQGLIDYEQGQRDLARLRADLLSFVDGLTLRDFSPAVSAHQLPRDKTGRLLYAIPPEMPLERETRCRVRLAFDEAGIRRGLDHPDQATVKPVRIAEFMDVALIDPNEEDTFHIRPLSSAEQFVERGDFTEWVFLVKPLRTGSYPLLLRIAVIEVRLGKERRKEIVLEETIQVVAVGRVGKPEEPNFKDAGAVSTAAVDEDGASEEADPAPRDDMLDVSGHPPPSPRISTRRKGAQSSGPPPQPAPVPDRRDDLAVPPSSRQKASTRRRWLAIAASLALVVAVGLWTLTGDRSPSAGSPYPNPDESESVGQVPDPDSEGHTPDTLARDSLN